MAVRGAGPGARLLSGWCFGIAQLSLGVLFVLQFSALGYLVLVVIEALFFALAALLTPTRCSAPALCGALALAEWAREHVPFGGLPPGGLPLTAAASPYSALARLGGPALLSLAICATGVGVALLVEAVTMRVGGSQGLWWGGATLAGVVLVVAVGAAAPNGGPASRHIQAVAVQGGGARGLGQISTPSVGAFGRTYEEAVGLDRHVQLELWPEDTVPLLEGTKGPESSALGQGVGTLARSLHATVLAGVTEPVGKRSFLNEVVAFEPSGEVSGSIEKVHPVPFGEYVPLRSFLGRFVGLAAVPRDALAGHNDGLLRTAAGPIGVLISYETFYPSRGRTSVRAGAEVLVTPTNTASYSSSQVPAQELAATRLQAIATGRDVLQAATTGYSALVAPSGEVLERTGLGEGGLLFAMLPLRSGLTPFDRFGELPSIVLALLLVLASWLRALLRGRRGALRDQGASASTAPIPSEA